MFFRMFLRPLAGALVALSIGCCAFADAVNQINFSRHIRPILSDNCFPCHGPDEAARQADLRLDTRDGLLGDADRAGVVVPRNLSESKLIGRILASDSEERMPPAGSKLSLSAAEIRLLQAWVQSCAPWQQHWSFVAPVRPLVPPVFPIDWAVNPIDALVLRKLREAGLRPNRPATKEKLIRRVTLDLTGVPPTLAEIDRFLTDQSPESYEKLVDRLFDSPRYGERMAWDWLEAARYADTNGFQGDPLRTMWPWRDWVVDALNANLPYDEFTIHQLAGDLLPAATIDQKIATGFNRNHMHNGEGGRIAEETRVENVLDRVETTATVWLGLTMTCCRCHDHKFDPLSQREYYQLYAYFNNTSEDGSIPRQTNVEPTLAVPTARQASRQAELAEQIEQLSAQIELLEAARRPANASLPKPLQEILSKPPAQRSVEQLGQLIGHLADDAPDYSSRMAELKRRSAEQKELDATIVRTMVMDSLPAPRRTFVLDRGLYNKQLQPVVAGVPAVLPRLAAEASSDRLALATWLVRGDHPLMARVTVNRYWQTIFGQGLVATPGDFGVQGGRPSHPELLDWLAAEFVESGWNIKSLQKMMVMSATYRQSANLDSKSAEVDPDNRLLSHAPRDRMPAWMIRDAALAVSGLLVEQLGGPPVKPYQPPGIWREASFGKMKYEQDQGPSLYRRSLYTFWRRIVGPTMFFDAARRQTCSVQPSLTNTPLHALVTLNDVTFVEAARVLAERVMHDWQGSRERIVMAFRLTTSRTPNRPEIELLVERLESLRQQFTHDGDAAERLISAGDAARDQQLDPAEHAAYASVCLLLLNLDEALTK